MTMAEEEKLKLGKGVARLDAAFLPGAVEDEALHARLADLLRRYDVDDYTASVKVFAVKPA
jgi:hypothetical protein